MNWKPVRQGNIYCAPACGGNCTYSAYQQAERRANQLAKKLGVGWTVRIWENLGWYYKVISPDKMLTIHPNHTAPKTGGYFLSFDVPGVGQIATITGVSLYDCLSELSNTLHQRSRAFEAALSAMKRITSKSNLGRL
jgi:hypothetical protein